MNKEVEEFLRVQRKLVVLENARAFGSNLETYTVCGIPKSTFCDRKKAYNKAILMKNLNSGNIFITLTDYMVPLMEKHRFNPIGYEVLQ